MLTRSGQIYYQPMEYEYITTRSGKRYKRDPIQKEPETYQYTSDAMTDDDCVPMEVSVEVRDMSFTHWKDEINKMFTEHIGTSCDFLGDFPYYDCYVENMEPVQVFNRIMDRYIQEEQDAFYHDFLDWRDDINALLQKHFQTNITDIPDLPYYDSFCEGFCPVQMLNYIQGEFFV